MSVKLYYERGPVRLYCGDCLDWLPFLGRVDVLVTDPPYGIDYRSGKTGQNGGTALPGIVGDGDTSLRDYVLSVVGDCPCIVFGSWKVERPANVKALLIWDKGDHVGMGDLSLPWKPNTEEIYVIGGGFKGHRGSSVLRFNAPVSWNSVVFGRSHPHEKPEALMEHLVEKCPDGIVVDPFFGSGTTAIACVRTGRKFIGCEIEEMYCEVAAKRIDRDLDQGKLFDKPEVLPPPVQKSLIDELCATCLTVHPVDQHCQLHV